MPQNYTSSDRKFLLALARKTLVTYFQRNEVLEMAKSEVPAKLLENRGVFVTLTKKGKLRGCIGYLEPVAPIYRSVMENTLNAALEDPRFDPVKAEELDELNIEISILTLPEELKVSGPEEYLSKLRPLIDGVILKNGRSSATYLPQVWEEIKEPKEFLGSLCFKAGLEYECWRLPNTKIMIYQAEVFKE